MSSEERREFILMGEVYIYIKGKVYVIQMIQR